MYKKILATVGILWSISGFAQPPTELNQYSPPQVVKDYEIRLLPGFHANSRDGNYNNGESFIAALGAKQESQSPAPAFTPKSGENYVYSREYLVPVTNTNEYAPQIQSIQYFDGLGRAAQSISIKSTPNAKDVVTPFEYDPFGRQVKEWLPLPQSGASQNGKYYDAIDTSHSAQLYGNSLLYSEKKLEDSPLDRLEKQAHPGAEWGISTSHTQRFGYFTNNGSDVLKFRTETSWSKGITKDSLYLATGNYYPEAQLYKNRTIDEDGNVSYEFKNGQGQILLIRKMLDNDPADTYYVYNDYNQLAYVVPPLASAQIRTSPATDLSNSTSELLKHLCYQYRYDRDNHLAEKKLPGKGWESMVYDKADRLIMTQDEKLKDSNKWLITKYDQFGRSLYTGLIPGGSRESMQVQAENLAIVESYDVSGFARNGLQIYYTNSFFVDIETVLSVNYYDTYPSYAGLPAIPSTDVFGQKYLTHTPTSLDKNANVKVSTKGLPTASLVKTLEANTWTKAYMLYDQKGREIATYSSNHLGGYTKTESELSFSGMALRRNTYHKRGVASSPAEVSVKERFIYDFQNRLQEHYHQVDHNAEVLLTQNSYDELGRLANKKVGNDLQSIDYDYNIRGWMTGINLIKTDPLKPLDITKAFAYKIKYNNPENPLLGTAKYNGNIAEIDWTYGSNSKRRYGYQYDALNRLLKANYQEFNLTTTSTPHFFDEEITYDLNGNIRSLNRYGRRLALGGSPSAILIDKLKYYYENNGLSNTLTRITDNEGLPANITGYPGGGATITYDANGNMKKMPDKGITQDILYNHLNLPRQIIQMGNPVSYGYRADGVKVSKLFVINNENIATDYLDSFVYTSRYSFAIDLALRTDDTATKKMASAGQEEAFILEDKPTENSLSIGQGTAGLEFFPTSEGFYDYKNSKYIYQYKDHLGNVRLSYSRNSSTGALNIEESNDYYPFGMNFVNAGIELAESQFSPSATYKNYKYNGKELQETGMYDYGARFYMPDIARFGTQDPMQVFDMWQSSYVYANNNPVLYQDEYGLGILNVIGNFFHRLAFGVTKLLNSGCNCGISMSTPSSVHDAWIRPDFPSNDRPRRGTPTNATAQNNTPTQPVSAIASNSAGVILPNFSSNIPDINPSAMPMPNIGKPDITPQPTRPPLPTNVEFDRNIYFNADSLKLYDEALTEKTLYDLISTLQEHAELKVMISGNTGYTPKENNNTYIEIDGKPSNVGNLKLGRARAIMKLLTKKGIDASRILLKKGRTSGEPSTTFKLIGK